MINFFRTLFSGDGASQKELANGMPEVVVRAHAAPGNVHHQHPKILDEESGRVYRVLEDAQKGASATASATATTTQQTMSVDGSATSSSVVTYSEVVEVESENENYDTAATADRNNNDDDGGGGGGGGFYDDMSDEEPGSDFLSGCFEYLAISDLCYALRRVGSHETSILAHESTPLVAFCYALDRETRHRFRLITEEWNAKNETQMELEIENGTTPLGMLGWFVKNVMNDRPVFAFDSENDDRMKRIVDLTTSTATDENPAVAASGGASGTVMLENGHESLERARMLLEIKAGLRLQDDLDSQQFALLRQNLRRFTRKGRTTNANDTLAAAAASNSGDPDDGFRAFSPVTDDNGRWFVVTPVHYALFESYNELVSRSGASLVRLSQIVDQNMSVFSAPTPGCSSDQEKAVLTHFLQSALVVKERSRDHARNIMVSNLRAKCGQLVAQKRRLTQVKVQPQSLLASSSDSDADILKFVDECLADISATLDRLDADQRNTFIK